MSDASARAPATAAAAGGGFGAHVAVRLTLTTCGLIVGTCLVLSMVLVRRHLADMGQALIERGRTIAGFLAREAELGVLSGDVATLQQLAAVAREHPDVAYCRFFDRHGRLLVSAGGTPAGGVAAIPARAPDAAAVSTRAAVWEFVAPIDTTTVAPQREDLIAGGADAPETKTTREKIGAVAVGIALGQLHARRRMEFGTAAAFTIAVAVLAVVGAAVLLLGTLRALANAAALAEERSRLAELKTMFVAQASHEFRTPLAIILASCDLLQRYGDRLQPSDRTRRLQKIRDGVRHMTELLEDVLRLGRAESGRIECLPRPTDLEALCRDVVADVRATASDTDVVCRFALDAPTVAVDPKLVRQILRNLLGNAVKYSAGGHVVLDVRHRDGRLTFRVEDDGIGIPAPDQQALFEPFHRGTNVGRIPGSGLGLAITRNAVVAHRGTITVESAPGRGTAFTVALAAAATADDAIRSAG